MGYFNTAVLGLQKVWWPTTFSGALVYENDTFPKLILVRTMFRTVQVGTVPYSFWPTIVNFEAEFILSIELISTVEVI